MGIFWVRLKDLKKTPSERSKVFALSQNAPGQRESGHASAETIVTEIGLGVARAFGLCRGGGVLPLRQHVQAQNFPL
jgi:hypothetical protein